MHLVSLAVKTLQKLMDYSSPAVSLFKDLGGVELLSQRLHVEVQRVILVLVLLALLQWLLLITEIRK